MAYKDQLQNVLMEIAIMQKLQHPNLIKLHEVIDDDENDKIYMGISWRHNCALVMDYAKHGEILRWNVKTLKFRPFDPNIEHLSEKDIKKYMRHCVRGLHYSKWCVFSI